MSTPKFSVGDKVIMVNDYGVVWPGKTITEIVDGEIRGVCYHYTPTETPWFPSSERNIFPDDGTETIFKLTLSDGSEKQITMPGTVTVENMKSYYFNRAFKNARNKTVTVKSISKN